MNDLISRQAVLDEINRIGVKAFETYNDYSELFDFVDSLPFVSTEKTGHWKRISMDKYVQHAMAYYRCSECGKDIIGEHNYCPNCGCRMMEVEE